MLQHPGRAALAAAAAFLLAAAAACDDNPFLPGSFAVDGRWRGSVLAGTAPDTVRFGFDLRLRQEVKVLSGSGEVTAGGTTVPVSVRGDWEFPRVVLRLDGDDVAPLLFTAEFAVDTTLRDSLPPLLRTRSDSIVGSLTGSGLNDLTLTLGRATATP